MTLDKKNRRMAIYRGCNARMEKCEIVSDFERTIILNPRQHATGHLNALCFFDSLCRNFFSPSPLAVFKAITSLENNPIGDKHFKVFRV